MAQGPPTWPSSIHASHGDRDTRPFLNPAQGFNWESSKQDWWGHVEERASFIAECGFTTVWLPPPSDSVSREGYMCVAHLIH